MPFTTAMDEAQKETVYAGDIFDKKEAALQSFKTLIKEEDLILFMEACKWVDALKQRRIKKLPLWLSGSLGLTVTSQRM